MKIQTIKVFEHNGKFYKSKEEWLKGFIKTELEVLCANMSAPEIINKLASEGAFRLSFKAIINNWIQEIEVEDEDNLCR